MKKIESSNETEKLRRTLKAMNTDYRWAKKVNLMTPIQLRDAYESMTRNRPYTQL